MRRSKSEDEGGSSIHVDCSTRIMMVIIIFIMSVYIENRNRTFCIVVIILLLPTWDGLMQGAVLRYETMQHDCGIRHEEWDVQGCVSSYWGIIQLRGAEKDDADDQEEKRWWSK